MDRVIAVGLLLLFLDVVTGLSSQANTWVSSAVNLSKVATAVPLYVLVIMLFKRGNLRLSPAILYRFLLPALGILCIALIHFSLSAAPNDRLDVALKEIIRIVYCALLIASVGLVKDYRRGTLWLFYGMAVLGGIIGVLSVVDSFTGYSSNSGRYVDGILRAGSDVVDSNMLAGTLNACSFLAFGVFLTTQKKILRALLLVFIIIAQTGRIMTFSTGGYVSFAISILVAIYFYWRYLGYRLSRITIILVSLFIVASFALVSSGLANIIFYRLELSDKYVYASSIGSRLLQYKAFYHLLGEHPMGLLTGFGTADLVRDLGVNLDLHNSYLRSLGTGGIINFTLFLTLWWFSFKGLHASVRRKDALRMDKIRSIWALAAFTGWAVQMAVLPADESVLTWFFIAMSAFIYMHSIGSQNKALMQYGLDKSSR